MPAAKAATMNRLAKPDDGADEPVHVDNRVANEQATNRREKEHCEQEKNPGAAHGDVKNSNRCARRKRPLVARARHAPPAPGAGAVTRSPSCVVRCSASRS